MSKLDYLLAMLIGIAILIPSQVVAQTQATCAAYLVDNPDPADITPVSGAGVAQRSAFLADGGKLVSIGSSYYTVSIPSAFYTATTPVVVFDLHGTGGYPEAEWNDWHSLMAERGYAFIGLAWGGGTPGAATDTEIYTQLKQILQDVGAYCPIASARKWLMGFSVGSAMSYAVMIRDVADQKMFWGQIAVSGAAIGPLTTGKDVMHSTVEDNRANANAVFGIKAWMYCGEMDFDHGWSMCTEMPNGESFVNEHGGQAVLYMDPSGTHHSLSANPAAYDEMLNYLVSNPASATPNYTDSWYNANESGWGITITDHDTNAFVQWYTYDQTGHNQKYVISGGTFSNGKCLFSGDIKRITGPSWDSPTFDPNQVTRTTVGSGTIDFCPAGLADGTIVFDYTAEGVTGSKQLSRLSFGNDVTHWEGTANTGASDFSDLWWNSSESGWGVSVTQHGNNIFFRIFTYDTDNRPLLFIVPGVTFNSSTSFTGNLVLTSGPWYGTEPFDPNQVTRTTAGTATLTFSDANNGVLSYTVNGVTVTKTITRLVF